MNNDRFSIYEWKIHPAPFAQIIMGIKTYEMRVEDPKRPVSRGDVLDLREWDPHLKKYTGAHVLVSVSDVSRPATFFGKGTISEYYVIFSIKLLYPTTFA